MQRKFIIALAIASLLVFTFALSAMAAGPGTGGGTPALDGTGGYGNAMRNFVDADGDGTCDNFVDEDGDGVCDNAGSMQNFVDEDGDGVCDNAAQGRQGQRSSTMRGRGQGLHDGSGMQSGPMGRGRRQ